ncbi:hypothetical protein WDU94_001653, partial [Cyamophila willieti]
SSPINPASPLVKKFKSAVDKCKTTLSASQETVDLIGKKALPADESQRCFLECVYKDLDIVKDNKFDAEVVQSLAKERFPDGGENLTKASNMIDTCAKEIAPDATESCAMGKAVRSCFFKYADEVRREFVLFCLFICLFVCLFFVVLLLLLFFFLGGGLRLFKSLA